MKDIHIPVPPLLAIDEGERLQQVCFVFCGILSCFIVCICDMIKGNESDVGNIDFELQDKNGDKLLCFTLFLKLNNCSHLCNQMFD